MKKFINQAEPESETEEPYLPSNRIKSQLDSFAMIHSTNVINLSHMSRGGVYPLPLWFAIFREGVNPSPTLRPLILMAKTYATVSIFTIFYEFLTRLILNHWTQLFFKGILNTVPVKIKSYQFRESGCL